MRGYHAELMTIAAAADELYLDLLVNFSSDPVLYLMAGALQGSAESVGLPVNNCQHGAGGRNIFVNLTYFMAFARAA